MTIKTKFDADAWLAKELAAKAAEEAKEVVSPAAAAKMAEWLCGYAKMKLIKNYGGNWWGFNRNRCTVVKPAMIKAMKENGFIEMVGTTAFKMWSTNAAE